MGNYVIDGGRKLNGELKINGSKNSVLPILAATILNKGESIIHNCPEISDVYHTLEILKALGCRVQFSGKTAVIDSSGLSGFSVEEEHVGQMRSSIIFLGALLGGQGEVRISRPGGCEIGKRPIDLHLKALSAMGAYLKEYDDIIHAIAPRLMGTKITLPFPSVGATENIMLAAVMAKGVTTIENAAREPEIADLQDFLNKMGGRVTGAGSGAISVFGVEKLSSAEHTVIPDRIEAGTYLTAAAITKGDVCLRNVRPDHMGEILRRLEETGARIQTEESSVWLRSAGAINPIDEIKTWTYPGFPTDMQPQMMSLLTTARGTSIIVETVFESRFGHIAELCKMGADIEIYRQKAVIKGVPQLHASRTKARDLRGGAALILAALSAEGQSVVENSIYVERGYERIEENLRGLGAEIVLQRDECSLKGGKKGV